MLLQIYACSHPIHVLYVSTMTRLQPFFTHKQAQPYQHCTDTASTQNNRGRPTFSTPKFLAFTRPTLPLPQKHSHIGIQPLIFTPTQSYPPLLHQRRHADQNNMNIRPHTANTPVPQLPFQPQKSRDFMDLNPSVAARSYPTVNCIRMHTLGQ